jgi:hypothetical protein
MLKSGELSQVMIAAAVVVFFAIVHATSQLKVHREQSLDFDLIDFAVLMIIGCGSGALFGLGAILIWENNFVAIVLLSAVGAVSGMAGLNKFASIMLDIFTGMLKK